MKETVSTHPLGLWLKAVGRSGADFAKEMKVSRAYMSLILRGRRAPRQFLLLVSERTGIPYDRLKNAAAPRKQEAA